MTDDAPRPHDRLSLIGMRFEGRHGVLPAEKVDPQPFEVDVVLHADLAPAARSDDIRDTADYAALFDLVRGIVEGPSRDLIEALAGSIADAVLGATDAGLVAAVEVRVRKPDAPIGGAFRTVEAAVVRGRDGIG
jgi:7,8-dihydroneopterin aldolase/epimerase/oxygenase